MTVAVFVYADWQAMYPQFAATVTSAPQAQGYFNQATLYCSNTACAPIPYDPANGIVDRLTILYMLTAHIAQLAVGSTLGPASNLIGAINTAGQGSVSVGTDVGTIPAGAVWFYQTQFGISAYAAMAPYRTARYRASPGRFWQGPGSQYGPGYGYGWGRVQ